MRHSIADLRAEMAADDKTGDTQPTNRAVKVRHRDTVAVQQLRAQIEATHSGIVMKRAEQSEFNRNIRLYQDRIVAGPKVEERYKLLTRDYQSAQTFYETLLSKMNQSKMASDLEKRQQGEQFRIMDAANLPEGPSSPKRVVYVVGGSACGLLIGLLFAASLEYRNTALRTVWDVQGFLGFEVLTELSFIEGTSGGIGATLRQRPTKWLRRLWKWRDA